MATQNPVIVAWSGNLPETWTALSATAVTASVEVITPPGNTAAVQIRVDGGTAQSIPPGVGFTLSRVDLSRLSVQGAAASQSLVVAGEAPGA